MVTEDRRKYISSAAERGGRENGQNKGFHRESAFTALKKATNE